MSDDPRLYGLNIVCQYPGTRDALEHEVRRFLARPGLTPEATTVTVTDPPVWLGALAVVDPDGRVWVPGQQGGPMTADPEQAVQCALPGMSVISERLSGVARPLRVLR